MFQIRYLINVSIEISHKHHMRLLRNIYEISQRFRFLPGNLLLCKTQIKRQLWKFSVWLSREKSGKEFVMRLVFDPRVGLKRFFNEVIKLFSPTRRSNTSRITNSLSLFSLLNHTLN